MDESRWNEVLDPPAARLLSCPSANWIHIIIFSSNYSEEGFPGHNSLDICIWVFCGSHFFEYLYLGIFVGHNSLDICIWVQFFGYFYLAIFAGHISLDICIWVFLWVTILWIFVFGYFCGSCFFGYLYLGILRVTFL